jgi:undecaprenyl-diphosphatase
MLDTIFIFGAKYLFLLSIIIAAAYFFRVNREVKREMIIFALITFPLAFVLSLIARELYFNPRPFVVGGFEPLIPHKPDNGFPSDHMLLVATIAAFMGLVHKKISFLLWAIAILVGLSRIYAGVHHFIDILGSVLIAMVSATAAYAIIHKLWKQNKQPTNTPFP